MAVYVAFLRAINLGANRKFPKDAIKAATEAAGFGGVETYINTGNVRLESTMRSVPRIAARLEAAYLADRGFAVPTVVLTPRELTDIVGEADQLWAAYGEPAGHAVTLYPAPPSAEAVAAVTAYAEGTHDHVHVSGRWAHVLLGVNFHQSRLLASKEFGALGQGTARNASVLRAISERWC